MELNINAAKKAVEDNIAAVLGLDLQQAAWGIHEIINEDCARAFRIHASERGVDYRNCSMVAFGGSGPIHALRIARKLKIPRVLFPFGAGVFSAFGLLVSPLSFDSMRSMLFSYDALTPEIFTKIFQPLLDESIDLLWQAGVVEKDIEIVRRLDMRYVGQGFEIEITLPASGEPGELIKVIPELYANEYRKRYSISLKDDPIEIVNWKVEAKGKPLDVGGEYRPDQINKRDNPLKGRRDVYFHEAKGYVSTPVYDRYALSPGDSLPGPAVVEEKESTCVIGDGDKVTVDAHYTLIAEIGRNDHEE